MHILEHFDTVFILQTDAGQSLELSRRCMAAGVASCIVDLSQTEQWPEAMRERLTEGRPSGPGLDVLVMAPCETQEAGLWRPHDGLVERLETTTHHVAILGHRDGQQAVSLAPSSSLMPTDGVPTAPCAVAFSSQTLLKLLDLMPLTGTEGPLTPEDWLSISLWMSQGVVGTTRCLMAWPALLPGRPSHYTPTLGAIR